MQENRIMEEILNLIETGYGYSQMLDKMEMTEDDLINLCAKHLDFKNKVEKRYRKSLDKIEGEDVSKRTREIRRKSKGDSK